MPPELRDNRNAIRSAGVGVAGIEQRVRELGGTIEIRSNDRGTTIDVVLPLAEP
jgi:signal transduction histidine kinase